MGGVADLAKGLLLINTSITTLEIRISNFGEASVLVAAAIHLSLPIPSLSFFMCVNGATGGVWDLFHVTAGHLTFADTWIAAIRFLAMKGYGSPWREVLQTSQFHGDVHVDVSACARYY